VLLIAAGRVFPFYAVAAIIGGSVVLIQSIRGDAFDSAVVAHVSYFPPLIFLAASICAIWQLKQNNWRGTAWWKRNGAITIAGVFAFAVYLDLFPRPDFYHLVRIFPLVFVFFCALLVRWLSVLTEQLKRRKVPWPHLAGWLIAAAPVVFLVVAGERNCWQHRFYPRHMVRAERDLIIGRGRGIMLQEDQAAFVEGLVRLIQDNSSPDDFIFSFPQSGSGFYFLAARKNPTRFLWWSRVGIEEDEKQEMMSLISSRELKLILTPHPLMNGELEDRINATYHPVGVQAEIAVYSRNE
jgi:hypothetical protein